MGKLKPGYIIVHKQTNAYWAGYGFDANIFNAQVYRTKKDAEFVIKGSATPCKVMEIPKWALGGGYYSQWS